MSVSVNVFASITSLISFMKMLNNNDDRGSPCFKPYDASKNSEIWASGDSLMYDLTPFYS